MPEADKQPKEVIFDIVDSCFGANSDLSALTVSAYEAAQQHGPDAVQALKYGLMPHLKTALASGFSVEDQKPLINYLHCFETMAAEAPQLKRDGRRVLAPLLGTSAIHAELVERAS